MRKTHRILTASVTLAALAAATGPPRAQEPPAAQLTPATMKRAGKVDARYQFYNVEMLEVTGGRFWKPYKDIGSATGQSRAPAEGASVAPAGMDPGLYQYRPPKEVQDA